MWDIYTNQDDHTKIFNGEKYYLPKGIIKNYDVINNGKIFYNIPIDSDIKQYKEIKKVNNRARRRLPKRVFITL